MIKIVKVKNYEVMSSMASQMIAEQISGKPDSVLGFATGSTPIGTYAELVKMFQRGQVDFSRVVTFNLDEYRGLQREFHESYYYFMRENLFGQVNMPEKNIHIPHGMAEDIKKECEHYEQQILDAGGIDLQLLGVGLNGHIGFNEPDVVFYNKTRLVELTEDTIKANARFFNDIKEVPTAAISMGIGTIMAARKIVLIAGVEKADVVKKLEEEVVLPQFPVSILHYHQDCVVIAAQEA